MNLFKIILITSSILLLTTCGEQQTSSPASSVKEKEALVITKNDKTKTEKTFTVRAKSFSTKLFFNGSIKPLSLVNVQSPVEGAVVSRDFRYGEKVKKGQLLFKINSEQLIKDYNAALTSYLRAKEKLQLSKTKATSSKELYDLGIIARNEYEQDVSALHDNQIEFIQALHTLQNITTTDKSSIETLKQLTIEDMPKIEKALKLKYSYLDVTAPKDGIALFPPDSDSDDSGGGKVNVGSQVKLGQVLVSIGDLTGISADVSVTEVNIDKIKKGQKVIITGVAFPHHILHGYVKDVTAQASAASSGGLPSFPATVVVKKLTDEQRILIRVGMSAKIQVDIKHKNVFMVPIDAIFQKQGQSRVKKKVGNKIIEVPVTTGSTTFNDVEIRRGVKDGDQLIYTPKDQVIVND